MFPVSTGEGHRVGLPPAREALWEWCGLDGLRRHDVWHCFASISVAAGGSLSIIGALRGSADSATNSRYAHLVADPLKPTADRIAGAIAKAMQGP